MSQNAAPTAVCEQGIAVFYLVPATPPNSCFWHADILAKKIRGHAKSRGRIFWVPELWSNSMGWLALAIKTMIKFHICRAKSLHCLHLYHLEKKRSPPSKWKPTHQRIRNITTVMKKDPCSMKLKKNKVVNQILNSKIMFYLEINYYLELKESLCLRSTCPVHFMFSSVWLKYGFLAFQIQSLLLYVSDLKLILQRRECFWEGKPNEKNIVKLEDI